MFGQVSLIIAKKEMQRLIYGQRLGYIAYIAYIIAYIIGPRASTPRSPAQGCSPVRRLRNARPLRSNQVLNKVLDEVEQGPLR